jgi:hypothetical protein
MKNVIIALILVFSLLPANRARSREILQPQSSGTMSIFGNSPVGQTFTAQDPLISSIGLSLHGMDDRYPTNQLTYELRQGAGTSGSLLASRSFTLPTSFDGFADADFSSVTLSVGEVYTVLVSASDYGFGVRYLGPVPRPGMIGYTGGEAILWGQLRPDQDLSFRVEPIPEPSSAGVLLAGSALVLVWRKRGQPMLSDCCRGRQT